MQTPTDMTIQQKRGTRRARLTVLGVFGCVGALGCSSSSAPAAPNDDGPASWGDVYFAPTTSGVTSIPSFFSAGFGDSSHPQPNAYCTTAMVGPCRLSECTAGDFAPNPHAGIISLTSSPSSIEMKRLEDFTVAPEADGNYFAFSPDSPAFGGGETITFSASGGTVPAFTQDLTVPPTMTLTSPTLPADDHLKVSRAGDVVLTWTGGIAGVDMDVGGQDASLRSLYCRVDSIKGTLTLPAAALSQLPAGSELQARSIAHTQVNSGPTWSLSVSLGESSRAIEQHLRDGPSRAVTPTPGMGVGTHGSPGRSANDSS